MARDQCIIERRHLLEAMGRQGAALPQELSGIGVDIVQASETAARHEIGVVVDREPMQQHLQERHVFVDAVHSQAVVDWQRGRAHRRVARGRFAPRAGQPIPSEGSFTRRMRLLRAV
jgi:hypothetical protein